MQQAKQRRRQVCKVLGSRSDGAERILAMPEHVDVRPEVRGL